MPNNILDKEKIQNVQYIDFLKLCEIKNNCLVIVAVSNKEKKINNEINQQLSDFPFVIKSPIEFIFNNLMVGIENFNKQSLKEQCLQLMNINEYNLGKPGMVAPRYSNFTMQESDLVIAVGTKLDASMIGYNPEDFAPYAKKSL